MSVLEVANWTMLKSRLDGSTRRAVVATLCQPRGPCESSVLVKRPTALYHEARSTKTNGDRGGRRSRFEPRWDPGYPRTVNGLAGH